MLRTNFYVLFAATACLAGAAAGQTQIQTSNPSSKVAQTNGSSDDLQIVTLQKDGDPDALVKELGLSPKFIYRHALQGFAVHLDAATITKLKADKRVLAVEPDGKVELLDQMVGTGVLRMGITNFPEAQVDGLDNHRINVNVAVLDTGIQMNHPDLNVVQAMDFTFSELGGNDWSGHGTHVAGIIGALDNVFGVVGVAPGVNLWDGQVISPTAGSWTYVLAGIDWVAQNADQIEVLNMSVGGSGSSPYGAVHEAVYNLVNLGVVVVAAAGNSSEDIAGPDGIFGTADDLLPAALPEVMAVSAMDPTSDTNAGFSNFSLASSLPTRATNYVTSPGGAIDVAAPGVNIYSTWTNSGYTNDTGTSMSCPHVVGLVALYIAANGRATNAAGVYAIRQAIINNSLPQSQWNATNTYALGLPAPLALPSENWIPLPEITSSGSIDEGFQVGFQAVPGYNYTVQSTKALGSSNQWTSLSTITGVGAVAPETVTDTNLASQAFYRLSRQPAP
jgi:subtilisin family serine protease